MPNTISDKPKKEAKDYISLLEANKLCSYSQEYLSLRARQGKLKAEKLGRNWFTTKEWLKKYVDEHGKDAGVQNFEPLQSTNWQPIIQKIGYGFLILLLGFGLLKISPNIISWTSANIENASQWLIQTGEKIQEQGELFAPASILDSLLSLDFAQLAQKINQNDHKVQATVLNEADQTLRAVQNISANALAMSLRGIGLSLQQVGYLGQQTSRKIAQTKEPINNLQAGIITNLQNLQNNIKDWENNIEQKIVNGAKSLVNFFAPGYYETKLLVEKIEALEQTQNQLEKIKQDLEKNEQAKIEIIGKQPDAGTEYVSPEKIKVIQEKTIIEKVIEEKITEKEIIPAIELAQIQSDLLEIRGLAVRNIIEEHKIYYGGVATPYDAAIGRDFSVGGSTFFGSQNSSYDTLAVYSDATFNNPVVFNALAALSSATISNSLTVNATSTFAGNILPGADDTYDLGSLTSEWRDLYIDGTAYLDGISSLGIAGEAGSDLTISAPEGKHVIINNFQTPYQNTITVAKSGADYNTITSALDAIADATSSNRYLIRVMPGTYSESIIMKEYIDIIGQDAGSTIIQQSTATVITTTDNSRLESVALNKTTDNTNPIVSIGATSPTLYNLILTGAGTSNQTGILVTTGSPDIAYVNISAVKYGLVHSGSTGLTKLSYSTFNSGTNDIYVSDTSNSTATTLVQSYFNYFTGANSVHIEIEDTDVLVGGIYLNNSGDLFPGRANAYDLGSATVDWDNIYANTLYVDTIYGQTDISGTTAELFTVNSDAEIAQDSQLRFLRGNNPSPNRHAVLTWDESETRFDFNFPLHLSQTGIISSASDLSITPGGDLSLTPVGGDLAINANTNVVGQLSVTYTGTGGNIFELIDGLDTVFTIADGGAVNIAGLTASRLVASDANKNLVSSDLASWVAGTTNQIIVTDDADGTITLSLPQDIHTGASPTFAGSTLTGTLDANGDVQIADTDIAFDGASTTFTITGAFTLTPGGAVLLGDGGDTMQINSSNWAMDTSGNLQIDGTLQVDGATVSAISATTINLGTANVGSTIQIGTEATTADTITIGNSNAATTMALIGGDDWSITSAGALTLDGTVLDIDSLDFTGAGAITTGAASNLTLNPGTTGDVIFTLDTDGSIIDINDTANITGTAIDITNTALTSGTAMSIAQSASAFTGKLLNISASGGGSGTAYGLYSALSGAATANIAGYFSASGGTANYALIADAVQGDVVGGTGSGDDLLLISTSNATKGDIQFHSSSYYINSTGDLVLGGRMTFENAAYIQNEVDGTL
ncbi:MAG: hypothetical protein ABIG90_03210, partial [bacterium]